METIKAIRRIASFGLYRDFIPKDVKAFGKLNLFYGWNGSGKTTLAALFQSLEKRSLPPRFASGSFSLETSKGAVITSEQLGTSSLNVRVFNQQFVKDNIDWDKAVQGILLIAAENIEHQKMLATLETEHARDLEAALVIRATIAELESTTSSFLTTAAKNIKTSLQVLDTSDLRFLNYNKTKLSELINTNEASVRDPHAQLSDEEVVRLTEAAKPEQLPELTQANVAADSTLFQKAHERLAGLLKASASNRALERLRDHPRLQTWIETGRRLHEELKSQHCEYCSSPLTPERVEALAGHFNDEYAALQDRLDAAAQWLVTQKVADPALPAPEALYDEYRVAYKETIHRLLASLAELNAHLLSWETTLNQKIANQLDCSLSVNPIPASTFERILDSAKLVREVIERHNTKTRNFAAETQKSKQRLELHYAATHTSGFAYFDKVATLSDERAKLLKAEESLHGQKTQIASLTNLLSDAGVGAEEFNRAIHSFLGRSDISLRFDKAIGGYEIIREASAAHDGNLSEGEKTAIAFVYFMTKLREAGNKLEETVIVVDDPISSFDSNNLFHAYSYLREHCKEAGQLMVLTHNFSFYKLVRDWFLTTNKNRKKRQKDEAAFFYTVEAIPAVPRSAHFRNADESLLRYASEYHYLFGHLHRLRGRAHLTLEEAFLSANVARKLMEAFLAFKFPKQRGDLASLFDMARTHCKNVPAVLAEKIYRFINRYSHSAHIELGDESAENLHGEGGNIVEGILGWIEELDPHHFKEMVESLEDHGVAEQTVGTALAAA